MRTLAGYLIVFLGAGLGGALRHAMNRLVGGIGSSFPWHTLLVNVSGCFLMGLIAGWLAFRGQSGQALQLFMMTGILSGYTTFSAFSLDAALLWERGDVWATILYVGGSVALSVVLLFAGLAIMRTHIP